MLAIADETGNRLHMDRYKKWVAIYVALCTLPGIVLGAVTWIILRPEAMKGVGDAFFVRDYLNLWAGGKLAASGDYDTLFHPYKYFDWLKQIYGPTLDLHTWSYPPTMLYLAIPLATLPVVAGYLVWTFGSLAVLWGVLRGGGLSRITCLAVAVSPAVIENALAGQNGALTSALLEGGLLLVGRNPLMSGVLFGLLTAKPHLGILIPVCLLASWNWRTIAMAAATALIVFAASDQAFGNASWLWFVTDVRHFMTTEILEKPFGSTFQNMMATPFILVRWCGAGVPLAYSIQGLVTVCCVAVAWLAWREPRADPKARMALTAALALLATPYGYSYDTIGTAVGVAVLTGMALKSKFEPFEGTLLAAAWAWPGFAFWLGTAGLPPFGCLTLVGVAFCAWRRLTPWISTPDDGQELGWPSPDLALAHSADPVLPSTEDDPRPKS